MSSKFSIESKDHLNRIYFYFIMIYKSTAARVESRYIDNDYVINITENGRMVNNYVFMPNDKGGIGIIRETGINLDLAYYRYLKEGKVFDLKIASCDFQPDWGYIEFVID